MRTLLNQIDLVVECRDSRIPLTARNPLFEEVLADRQRIIVYTKKDLSSTANVKTDDLVGSANHSFLEMT